MTVNKRSRVLQSEIEKCKNEKFSTIESEKFAMIQKEEAKIRFKIKFDYAYTDFKIYPTF